MTALLMMTRAGSPIQLLQVSTRPQVSDVANIRIELAVSLVRDQHLVAEEVAGSLCLLGEGDDVGRGAQVPVRVAPELAGGTEAGLDLVYNHDDAVLLGDVTQALEEGCGSVVVAALALDRLDDQSGDREAPSGDETLDLVEATLLLLGILVGVLVKGVLEGREGRLRPVESGDVELVHGLGARGGQATESTSVERVGEAQDCEVGGARGRVGDA